MKTRTAFKLSGKGVVHCWCGSLGDFVADICEVVIPILEDSIVAEFNGREVVVSCYDNTDTLYQKFLNAMGG